MKFLARAPCQFRIVHPFQMPTVKQLIPSKLEEQYINSRYTHHFIAVLFLNAQFDLVISVIIIKARTK